jgi:phage shock protein PspC (stress-responsive transcriptional regulator)
MWEGHAGARIVENGSEGHHPQGGTAMTDELGQTGTQRDHGGVRRLQRRIDGRLIAGVAGGFADYTTLPAWVVRVAFVVLAFMGGAGILLYIAGWLLMPAEGEQESIAQGISHRSLAGPAWAGALLLFIGAALLANHAFFVAPAIIWGLGFIGLGIYLFFRADQANRDTTPGPGTWAPGASSVAPVAPASPATVEPATAPPAPPAPPAWSPTAETTPLLVDVPPMQGPPAPVRTRPRRERSTFGWFVLGVALAAVGILGFFDQIGAVSPRPVIYAALALMIVGAGLLLSAWIGRARWLIAVCLLLVPITAALSPVHVPIEGGFGDRFYSPASSADLTTPYRLIAGQMTIDLRSLAAESPAPTVTASVVAGRLRVFVPDNATIALSGHISAGVATVFGRSISGRNLDLQQLEPVSASAPDVMLRLDVTYGNVAIVHSSDVNTSIFPAPSPPPAP